jgi:hypothetical protein
MSDLTSPAAAVTRVPLEPPPAGDPPPAGVAEALRWSALAVAAVAGAGFAMAARLRSLAAARPESDNIFYRLYALHERPFFALTALFALVAWWYVGRPPDGRGERDAGGRASRPPAVVALLAVAALVGVVCWAGSGLILHGYPLAMDEFNAVFQAEILASGRLAAPLPAAWQPFGSALAPVFTTYYPDRHVWRSGYLPVYAAIRALFRLAGAESLTNPVLGALAVVALAAVGHRLWPRRERRTGLAVLFLVTSSQFLLTSMTAYSMPAHLLLNLVWLWLYLRDDAPGLAAAPVVGVLALGLHNPFPHALFVTPFLLRALRRRRIGWIAYAAGVYGAGALLWYSWLRASAAYLSATGGLLSTFGLPGKDQLIIQAMSLTLVVSWMPPIACVFALVALAGWRRLGDAERDVAAGLLLTAAFHLLFPLSQGHGWGYRYLYSALGNLVLLAAVGADWSTEAVGRARVARLVAASTLLALLVELPLRAAQIERFVRPFARASEYVATRPEPVVVVYPDSSYYGRDLVRNDPFLRDAPKVVSATALGDSGLGALSRRFGGRVHPLRRAELAPLGVTTF